jgi:tRNA nucleotidyltransferase (CCA-adding enzyme)
VAERDEVRTAIDLYYDDLRDVKPLLDGQALRSVGVPAGPAYARILAAVLSARLDGLVITLEDERLLAAGLAADLAEGATGSATGRVK